MIMVGFKCRRSIVLIFFLLLLCGIADANDDVLGWKNTKWGMSPEEVVKLYDIRDGKLDFKFGYDYFDLFPYQADRRTPQHNIRLFFDEKKGLIRVYEYMDFSEFDLKSGAFPVDANLTAIYELNCYDIRKYFNKLEEELIIKHGKALLDRKDEDEHILMWVFQSTVIRLRHVENAVFCTTTLEYVPNEGQ